MTFQIIKRIETAPMPDRIIREKERLLLTSISRSQAFQLERINEFPKRIRLSARSVGWRLSQILDFVESRQTVEAIQENK